MASDAARRLLAAPWRHPGLIVLCMLAGAGVAALSQRHPGPWLVAARAPAGPLRSAPHGVASAAFVAGASGPEDIEALMRQSPPAAAAVVVGRRGGAVVPGLAAGLLLGLLAAAARELRGDRMRSAGEAERALGVPVLGAVPTLSGRTRRALVAPAQRRDMAARR
jgi:hypothetical protein